MADVSKIKLPNQEVVNIKDFRITGVDATPTSGSTNVVTSGGAYAAIQDAIGDYVTLSTDQTITGSKTFSSAQNLLFKADANDVISTSYANAVSYSPLLWNAWHDHFAFLRSCSIQDVQYSTDGSAWSESSTDIKPLFIHKETTKITVLRTSDLAFRFTLYSYGAFHVCGIEWLVLGVNYANPFSAFNLKAEYSADNSAWKTWFDGNVTSDQTTHFLRVGGLASGQKYIRFTFTKTMNTTTGYVSLNIFSALTRRKGDQGQGREYSYPYQWDATPNVYPILNNTSYLGMSSYRWANVYSVLGNFSGALSVTGNTSIGGALGVTGDTVVNGTFRTLTTGGSYAKLLVYPSNPYGIVFKSAANGTMTIQSQRESNDNETFPLLLNPSGGNVGIGTSSPSEKLEVNGKIKSTSFVTSGGTVSQFVKGDGSLDSSTYVPTSAIPDVDAIAYIGDSQGSAQYVDEGGNIVDLSDYAKKTLVEAKNYLTAHQQLKTINNQSLVGEGNITISGGSGGGGDVNVIEAITFNGSAVPVTNKTAAITATIPSVTTSTVLNDGKLLTNGIDVNTKIRGAVFAASSAANADSSSALGFNTASGNPYIFLKQGGNTWYCQAYSGNFYFGPSHQSALCITPSGAGSVPSSFTADSFVKSGGTSAQFLKADGSVDSTVYATAAALESNEQTTSGAISNLEDRIETLENSSSSGGITNVSFNGSVATVNSSGVAEIVYALPSKTSDLTNDSGFKKITISSSEPTSSDGSNGDIWFVI